MKSRDYLKLAIALGVSAAAGIIGSLSTFSEIPTWYAGLIKPMLNPPAWVFGPVWSTLYTLMGISSFIVWRQSLRRREVRVALGTFLMQLGLNALWSLVFFGMHAPGQALVVIIAMWLAIVLTMIQFARISKAATYLLIPYLAWVSFATYLNAAIWLLN